jgi:hypothetical protein
MNKKIDYVIQNILYYKKVYPGCSKISELEDKLKYLLTLYTK